MFIRFTEVFMMKLMKGLFSYGALLFLVSCSAYTATPSPSTSETGISFSTATTDQVRLPTMTVTTLPESSLPLPVDPTSTPFILPTEEPVALSTISPDAVKPFVLELTNDNQNCLLPCFWNITPGDTEWQNAEAFLSTFAYRISYGATDGTFSDVPLGDSFIAWMYLFLPEISNAPFSYAFEIQDGIVSMIDAYILSVPNYTLPVILNDYGQPTEIWLLTANAPMDDVLGFNLTLFYEQHNFMLVYSGDGEIIDGKVRGCFSGGEDLHLVVWSPEKNLTFVEAVDGLHNPRPIIYDLPLEEATEVSVETFYDTFRNANEPACIETPIDLWPGP